nr:MAG TPA: PemK-like protein [Caudoviricetes sp.]
MNRWDVYWADVPFEDNPTQVKRRPVIIAKDSIVYVLTLKVTTHSPRENDPYDYQLVEWQFANLPSPSVVRIRKLAKLKPDKIHNYIGRLHPVDMLGIQTKMDEYRLERDRMRK